jgi:hypothetical protein
MDHNKKEKIRPVSSVSEVQATIPIVAIGASAGGLEAVSNLLVDRSLRLRFAGRPAGWCWRNLAHDFAPEVC